MDTTSNTRVDVARWLPWAPLLGATVAVLHLGWEALHGGIQGHHLLARADLPSISNAWGVVLLPTLGWLASYFVRRRSLVVPAATRRALVGFLAALALGVGLSAAFKLGLDNVATGLFATAFLAGLVVPTYRAEYAFGFVIGMVYVFGAVIPTLAAAMMAAISGLAHFVVRPLCAAACRRLRASP